MLHQHESVIEQVRQLAAPLTSSERLALIQAIAALENVEDPSARQARPTADTLAVEQATWFARPAAERQRYAGQYVAVEGGQVIDQDSDQRTLYLRIRKRFGARPVLIVNADWDEPPTLVMYSPRMER